MSSNLALSQHPMNTSINNNSSAYFELENQFILRMPLKKDDNGNMVLHPSTTALRAALKQSLSETATSESLDNLKDRLFIELNTESRKGRIKFDEEIFEARLVDLPCIIESMKTTDKKMFYKTADICQMLVCKTQDDPWNSSDEEMKNRKDSKQKKGSEKNNNTNAHNYLMNKYKWPHGLAPPLKNVRRKRFRKVAKKKIIDYADIEKEVKQLFRADRDASKIDYEVLFVEGELDDENNDENCDKNNSKNNEDEFEDSSQEDIGPMADGNSCMDSALDIDSSKLAKPCSIKRTLKVSNLIEESNLSFVDDDSMMAAPTSLTKSKLAETDIEDGETTNLNTNNFDECSMDNSNLIGTSSKASKQRTGFKDLFVEEVLGDLSSSSDEDEDNNDEDNDDFEEDDDDENKNKKSEKVQKSFKFNLEKNSIHFTSKTNEAAYATGDESMSNFEDSNAGFANAYESDASNLDSALTKFEPSTEDENRQMLNQTKNLDILDANSRAGDEDDISLNVIKKKTEDDFNFCSDLSSSSDSTNGENKVNRTELNANLNKLVDELKKIKDDRKKRENEINSINNPVLKAHLTSRLNNLIEEETKKQNEIDELKALLNE